MLTELQLERRKKSLGSSDMSAVLGLNPYRSAYDVYLEKSGKLKAYELDSKAADAGNRFERAVLAWAKQQLGSIRSNVFVVAGNDIPIHSNVDAQVVASKEPVEAKTAGLFGPLSKDWGTPGSDEIPSQYIIQCQVHMICTGQPICHVPAFLGGRGFEMFTVKADKDLQEIIVKRAVEFWKNNVLADNPPADVYPDIEVVARRIRVPGKLVPVGIALINDWQAAKAATKQAEESEELAKIKVLTALGDAEGSEVVEGLQLKYAEQGAPGSKIDEKKLLQEFPEVFAKVKKPEKKIRVLRVLKVK